jgi:hypothetical protein
MERRYIPTSDISENLSNINRSRVFVNSSYLNNFTSLNIPSIENPYNIQIANDVRPNNNERLTQRKIAPVKYSYYNPNMVDIALYSRDEKPENNKIISELNERARGKVELKVKSEMRYDNNETIYNPYLPLSETNIPIKEGRVLDDRMNYFTGTKPYLDSEQKQAVARTLQPNINKEIIERNKRQKESLDAQNHHNKIPRYNEHKMPYNKNNYETLFSLSSLKSIEEKPLRLNRSQDQREGFDSRDIKNKLFSEIDNNFSKADLSEEQYTKLLKQDIRPLITNEKDDLSLFRSVIHTLVEPFKIFSKKDSKVNHKSNFVKRVLSKVLLINSDEIKSDEDFIEETIFRKNSMKERYTYKPDHLLILKQKSVSEFFPDDISDDRALLYVNSDGYSINRNLVMLENAQDDIPKLILIQKRSSEAIFPNDNMKIDNDFIAVDLPVQFIDKKLREKIERNNKSNRGNVLELEYEDFVVFANYFEQHPEIQRRMKPKDFINKIRCENIEDELIKNFDSKKVLMDYNVYNTVSKTSREKIAGAQRGRVDKTFLVAEVSQTNESKLEPYRQINHGKYSGNPRYKGFEKYKY